MPLHPKTVFFQEKPKMPPCIANKPHGLGIYQQTTLRNKKGVPSFRNKNGQKVVHLKHFYRGARHRFEKNCIRQARQTIPMG